MLVLEGDGCYMIAVGPFLVLGPLNKVPTEPLLIDPANNQRKKQIVIMNVILATSSSTLEQNKYTINFPISSVSGSHQNNVLSPGPTEATS